MSFTALLAVAVHQVRAAIADPAELEEAVGMLTTAAASTPLAWELTDDHLRLNGVPMPSGGPGTEALMRAFREHRTTRLVLPAGLTARQWRDVAELYASAPDLYASADQLRDALRASVPDAVVTAALPTTDTVDLRDAMFEIPGLTTAGATPSDPVLGPDPAAAERAEHSTRLDPLVVAAEAARARGDQAALAHALLGMHQLEVHADNGRRALIGRERRRVAPPEVLDTMVRALANPAAPVVIARAAATIGRDGAEALLRALDATTVPHERRTYADALTRARDGDEVVLQALQSPRSHLVSAAAEIIGRRQMTYAIPALGQLLRHREAEVRTAAWRALEQIGTREALEAMQSGR
ncbi:MAG TPA: HEAT repeat domain-containing protein [Gemmatimonadales bacterium]|jgi:hypothetical protein|nr:HEAT repeat domain-containing protein [Gemmatimonadales bacterium]